MNAEAQQGWWACTEMRLQMLFRVLMSPFLPGPHVLLLLGYALFTDFYGILFPEEPANNPEVFSDLLMSGFSYGSLH